MLISYNWIKEYFSKIPKPEKLVETFNLHTLEVDGLEKKILSNGKEDYIIDIDVTPNRSHDLLCHLGIAREISAVTGVDMKKVEGKKKRDEVEGQIKISVSSDVCRRYIAKEVRGVKVKESSEDIKEKLESLGQKNINNIVDATNIVMLELGQPLHAFDADKIDGDTIYIRPAKKGEEMVTLDNHQVKLTPDDLVIADKKDILAIAGVKGGKKAEVNFDTKNIIIESANFHPTAVRKTSKRIGILTDSSKRFENEITPALANIAMERVIELIEGQTVSKNVDHYPKVYGEYKTGVSVSDVENLLGINISEKEIRKILNSLRLKSELIDVRERVVDTARNQIGQKYRKGASVYFDAPNEFDCSSFTSYVYSRAGITIPRISIDQFFFGKQIERGDLKTGDLIFSNTGEGKIWTETREFLPGTKFEKGIDHVGIYLGGGEVIHASSSNRTGVEISLVDSHPAFRNIVGYATLISEEKRFVVTVPVERLDIRRSHDLVEEIGRIYGYEKIKGKEIDIPDFEPRVNKEYALNNRIRNILINNGYSEILTYSFVQEGEIQPEKPIAEDKAYLRTTLLTGLTQSLEKNVREVDLLGLDKVKVFEIGKVFHEEKETLMLSLGVKNKEGVKKPKESDVLKETVNLLSKELGTEIYSEDVVDTCEIEINLDEVYSNISNMTEYPEISGIGDIEYSAISAYPYMLRDIAVWVPNKVSREDLIKIISKEAGKLLVRTTLFDIYEKEGRTSYAHRLVFQSHEKTLSDEEINVVMERIGDKIKKKGWEIR